MYYFLIGLAVLFIALKLTGEIALSWLLVLLPAILVFLFPILIFLFLLVLLALS